MGILPHMGRHFENVASVYDHVRNTDPEIIDYFKYHFRFFGEWILAFGMLILLTAATGLRVGSRRAWGILFIVPILVGIHFFIWPWTAPILITIIILSGIGLWLSYPKTIAIENE